MWHAYFGDQSHIFGVDIEEACRSYTSPHTTILIGDQEDRTFWRTFKDRADGIDIVIDDGGHTPSQQRVTLEEMLPSLNPGGVYICEDIHGRFSDFTAFTLGLVNQLNTLQRPAGEAHGSGVNTFQSAVHSIHFYPYLLVIEKRMQPIERLSEPKHGTHWQPFL